MTDLPEVHQWVRLDDVVAVLRDLESGPHSFDRLYMAYMDQAEVTGGSRVAFGQLLTLMGVEKSRYHPKVGFGRFIDREALAVRWPNLDWGSPPEFV